MNLTFFRNPEIRKDGLICVVLWLAATSASGVLFGASGIIFTSAVCLIWSAVHLSFHHRRYQKIAALADEVQHFLHNSQTTEIQMLEEGELSVLKSEIHKLFMKLSLQSTKLSDEKRFLLDSIADISHQIRTPLTSLTLIASRLRQTDLEPSVRAHLIWELSSLLRHIDQLVESLLKMAKLDAGAIQMKCEPVSVRTLIEKTADELAITMELHNQAFIQEIKANPSFSGDFLWTGEALANIIKNCIDHTPENGTVTVRSEENNLYTRIEIMDDGPGIDKKDLPHLFERFYKGKNSGNQSIGIGLALAKMIIDCQNGVLTAENRPEGGALFSITFYKMTV